MASTNRNGWRGRHWWTSGAIAVSAVTGILLVGVSIATVPSPAQDRVEPWLLRAQSKRQTNKPAAGRLLVSVRGLPDPNFSETVILLTQYSEESAMGLVLNKPSKVPISRLFLDLEEADGRDDPVYIGGPVTPSGVLGLLRSRTEPEGSMRVFEDVYLVSSAVPLRDAIVSGTGPDKLRIFAGYSGWGAGQLDFELELGTWHIFKSDADTIFEVGTENLWEHLVGRTEMRVARLGPTLHISAPPPKRRQ